MIYADNTINHETCPDCGGDASDKERPESGWFVCQCGYEWSAHEKRRLETGTPEETQLGNSDKPISKRLGAI